MTVPVTGITPVFGLEYLVEGEPAFHIRQKWARLAAAIEAALVAGPASPPGASDLLAVSGRVTTLENLHPSRAAQAVTFPPGFSQFISAPGAYEERVRCWKVAPDEVRLVGIVNVVTALAAGATVTAFTLPAGYRPAVNVVRWAIHQPGVSTTATTPLRLNILPTGVVQLSTHLAMAGSTWFSIDLGFRTVNT